MASPIYYATGSYAQALSWAMVAGAAELAGGIVAYALVESVDELVDKLRNEAKVIS